MKKSSERQKRYDAAHTRRYGLKLNLTTDADVIERFEEVDSIQGYIKDLVRRDIQERKEQNINK